MSTQYEAPHADGVRDDLSASKQETLRKQLVTIRDAFVATHEQPVCDSFYLVVEHTKKHGAQATFTQLNGDTAEYLLGLEPYVEPVVEEVVEEEPVVLEAEPVIEVE